MHCLKKPLLPVGTHGPQQEFYMYVYIFLQGLSPEELALLALEVRQSLEGLTSPNLSNISTNRGIVPLSTTLAALTLKCVDSAKQVSTALQAFNAYHGPIPVPSFDAFVQAHKLLQQTLSKALLNLLTILQCNRLSSNLTILLVETSLIAYKNIPCSVSFPVHPWR